MAGPYPTPSHVAEMLRDRLTKNQEYTLHPWETARSSAIKRESAPHDVRRFDLTLTDGRVYRVRVSDITPEKVTT